MSDETKINKGEGEGESSDLFDYQFIKHCIGFVARGVLRHPTLAGAVFFVVLVAGSLVTWLYPRSFHVESKLLANRNQVVRAIGNPHSAVQSDDPTRAAEETIFAHDNLVALVKQTKLLESWVQTRVPILRFKDSILAFFGEKIADDDKLDAMVGTLETKLKVAADSKTVTISIDWPDPQLAYQLVESAQQNFLETRHVTEMSAISEALSILEVHAAKVQESVEESLGEYQKIRDDRRKGVKPPAASPVRPNPEGSAAVAKDAVDPAPSPFTKKEPTAMQLATEQELAQLKFLIQSKKRAVQDLEDFRGKRLAELNAQLNDQRIQYADKHPVIMDTLQRISTLNQDSPQLLQLRQDVHELTAEYKRKGGQDPDALVEPRRTTRIAHTQLQTTAALSAIDLAEDPAIQHAQNNLRVASAKYEDLMMRIDAARIELDTARAAFKYRYSVVRPASVPKKPQKPNVLVLIVVTLLGALATGAVAGAALDLWRGRLVEVWQVESALGLKVISEVKLP
jgi:uncharacterized protein involved in exopolysaccharide biosynthesis